MGIILGRSEVGTLSYMAPEAAHLEPMQRLLRLNDPTLRIELGPTRAAETSRAMWLSGTTQSRAESRPLLLEGECGRPEVPENVGSGGTKWLSGSPEFRADFGRVRVSGVRWNDRVCTGTRLHEAALEGDEDGVKTALAAGERINARFEYTTSFQGKVQEGSGEAIHLAASRGYVNVVRLLLNHKASVNAMVSRSHEPHYDVFHAAVFAEGRHGSLDMIRYLMEQKAELTRNQSGNYPIHMAFVTGSLAMIKLIRTYMKEKNVTDESCTEPGKALPLEMGITGGKMSERDLSEACEVSLRSLTTFIHECPQVIPSFLERLRQNEEAFGEVRRKLTNVHIAKVLQEEPLAALALLDGCTDSPECGNQRWHPLPTRVSFAPRTRGAYIRMLFNPPEVFLTEYQPEETWNFDGLHWKAPAWHQSWVDRDHGPPLIDAEIRVVHLPNLLCAEVFRALCDHKNDNCLELFQNDIIHVMIKHLFWEGAAKIDVVLVMLTMWGLVILIGEEVMGRSVMEASANGTELPLDEDGGFAPWRCFAAVLADKQIVEASWVAFTWIASKALVDLWLEYSELRGFMKIGHWYDWFKTVNLMRALLAGLPSLLLFWPDFQPILLCGIFLYWGRVLTCYTLMQYIGVELLPIIDLASGLGPSLFVTAISFGAFTHAFYLVRGSTQALWPHISTDTFAVLITAALPESASNVATMELTLILVAVLFFSVLILNVFIGVICELYANAKERAPLAFKQRRALCCMRRGKAKRREVRHTGT
ncbi:unnamed protein product [Effrenium voratum]|nr:unnamed protein product [Effrenium voratum]